MIDQVSARTCARNLKPAQVKRYPDHGALFGYFVACPVCGFTALHDNEAGFREIGERLTDAEHSLPCLCCNRAIVVHAQTITAH